MIGWYWSDSYNEFSMENWLDFQRILGFPFWNCHHQFGLINFVLLFLNGFFFSTMFALCKLSLTYVNGSHTHIHMYNFRYQWKVFWILIVLKCQSGMTTHVHLLDKSRINKTVWKSLTIQIVYTQTLGCCHSQMLT